jgi:hypothetical protein
MVASGVGLVRDCVRLAVTPLACMTDVLAAIVEMFGVENIDRMGQIKSIGTGI